MAQTVKAENDPKILAGVREFLKELNNSGSKPLETLTPQEARQVLADAQKSATVDYSGITETERNISQDGITVNIHIVKPANAASDNLPVFMFTHGGGWILGDYPTHRRLVRDLVVNSGAAAVFTDYTPSPEAQYPTAINEIMPQQNGWLRTERK